jgi:hypothetical protein
MLLVQLFLRRWRESVTFRLAVWLVAALAVLGIASISIQAAIIVAAIGIALSLNYGHALIWMARVTARRLRRR